MINNTGPVTLREYKLLLINSVMKDSIPLLGHYYQKSIPTTHQELDSQFSTE